MGSPQAAELSLDYKPSVYAMNTSKIAVGLIDKQQPDQQQQNTQKLQEFLSRLEEERLKIEAFKRELPLCLQLLNNAMEIYKQQLETYQMSQAGGGSSRPVLEEFIPLKNTNDDSSSSEKASWMVSAQLWNPAPDEAKQQAAPALNESDGMFDAVSPKLALDTKQRNGGAFLPFSKEKKCGARVLPELALASSDQTEGEGKITVELETAAVKRENCVKSTIGITEQGKPAADGQTGATQATQAHRKARRCWSPDLHRRFVNALQILGGSQVATPKQIRELMKVDGLTNDEVKSHLQKYRLHTRRPMQPPQPSTAAAPQLVVLGGIWVPPEYATTAAAAAPALYSHHPPPTHYCAAVPPPPPTVPQEYYRAQPPHQALHSPAAASAAAAQFKTCVGSPESDIRSGTGDQPESTDDHDDDGEEDKEEEKQTEKNALPVTKPDSATAGGVALKF